MLLKWTCIDLQVCSFSQSDIFLSNMTAADNFDTRPVIVNHMF